MNLGPYITSFGTLQLLLMDTTLHYHPLLVSRGLYGQSLARRMGDSSYDRQRK